MQLMLPMNLQRYSSITILMVSGLIGLSLILGCQKTTETGQARTKKFKPSFSALTVESSSKNQIDTSFLNSNHFACLVIDAQKIQQNPDLADVPWNALSRPLESMVGQANADLKKIERVWVLVDKAGVSFAAEPVNPVVLVLEYAVDFDSDAWQLAEQERQLQQKTAGEETGEPSDGESVLPTSPELEMAVKVIHSRRVAIGVKKLVDSLGDATETRVPLTEQLNQLTLDSDVEGAFTLEPIQPMVSQITSMFSRFGNDEFAAWKKLPQALRSTLIQLSLTEAETFHLQIKIEDEELANLILESAASAGAAATGGSEVGGNGGGQLSPLGAFAGMAGMGGTTGRRRPGRSGEETRFQMREIETTEQLEWMGKTIRENGLFSVKKKGDVIHLRLKRPDNLPELIKAVVNDSKSQFELAERVQKMNQIAVALKKYHDAHGVLPPSSAVSLENENQLPAQFNWQTGLLRYLDEEQYNEFRFNESWDSEHNQKVAQTVPEVFAFAGENEEADRNTRWMVVGGSQGVYRSAIPIAIDEIKDGKASTALVVEVKSVGAKPWTSPELVFDASADQIGIDGEKGAMFINAKFKVRAIERTNENFAGVLTSDGDEPISLSETIPMAIPGQ